MIPSRSSDAGPDISQNAAECPACFGYFTGAGERCNAFPSIAVCPNCALNCSKCPSHEGGKPTCTYIDKLKETITKVTEAIQGAFDAVDSPEFKAETEARYGVGNLSASKLGHLQGTIKLLAAGSLAHAAWLIENAAPEIAWGERCAAICEALGIDEDNIGHLELMTTDTEYHAYLTEAQEAISEAGRQVRDTERDYEREQAIEALVGAGFSEDQEIEDIWYRRVGSDLQQVTIEYNRRHHEFWYEFLLEIDNRETLRGKSGEFAGLLAAVGITQEVKHI